MSFVHPYFGSMVGAGISVAIGQNSFHFPDTSCTTTGNSLEQGITNEWHINILVSRFTYFTNSHYFAGTQVMGNCERSSNASIMPVLDIRNFSGFRENS